ILIIDLKDIISGSHQAEGRLEAKALMFNSESGIEFSGPLFLSVRISTTDQLTYYTKGWISFEMDEKCSRCLKALHHHQRTRISGIFAFPEALDRLELSGERLEEEGIRELEQGRKTIDLTDLVRECVLLDYPRFLQCSEDCKGLCPVCGCNLNERECNCARDEIDPRWAKLKELQDKGDN
ncbi:MAG: DUF177 domain-containing protein, partial [Gemmatimonadota bacterium]|nr:DUF177 domain-containing protein [Gemmatimonadota bacterium]